MRKLKEVLRLHSLGLKQQQIARSCLIAQSTVHKYLKAAASAGLSWPLPADWDERRLEEVVSGAPRPAAAWHKAGTPDFDCIRRQLQMHRNLTLQLAWEEYREDHPDGYSYSQYVAPKNMLRDRLPAVSTGSRSPSRRNISWT
jgi:transposase